MEEKSTELNIRDVKFASGIKILIIIIIIFFNYTPTYVSTVYTVLSRGTHDPCNSRAVSYQLDYRGCPVNSWTTAEKQW